jgi:Malectin domain
MHFNMDSIVFLLVLPFLFRTLLAYEVIFAVNAGDEATTDANGITYRKDNITQGLLAKCTQFNSIGEDQDKLLYRRKRYGNFSYDINVPQDGEYTVIMKFVECWTSAKPSVFDVYLNMHRAKCNIDVLKTVGAAKVLTEHINFSVCGGKLYFGEEEPERINGKVRIEFVTIKEEAMLSAMLVLRGDIDNLPSSLQQTNQTAPVNVIRPVTCEIKTEVVQQNVPKINPYTILHFYHISNSSLNVNVINKGGADSSSTTAIDSY